MIPFIAGIVLGTVFAVPLTKAFNWSVAKIKDYFNGNQNKGQ